MDLTEAICTRRSGPRLSEPAPGDDEISHLVQLAMSAPDHASLRPWRLVLLRGESRLALGDALAAAEGADPDKAARTAAKPLRAPLLIGIVFRPREHPKVPEWEQLAATVGVVTTLSLLLHGHGWAAMWRTGRLVGSPEVRRVMRVDPDEKLLGWLYVGSPDPRRSPPPRPQPCPEAHLSVL